MAALISLYLLRLTFFFSFSAAGPTIDHSSIPDLHDLLPTYGLPKGILPNNVKSYTLSPAGDFTVELESTCYVHFDQLVYYEKTIRGKLNYGTVHDVSGIQAKKLFLWLPVTGIEVDQSSGMIHFFVGSFSQELPAKQFEDIPVCKSKAFLRADLASITDALVYCRWEQPCVCDLLHTPIQVF